MRGRSLSAELRSELREAEIEGRLFGGFSPEGLLGMVAGTAGDGSESPANGFKESCRARLAIP